MDARCTLMLLFAVAGLTPAPVVFGGPQDGPMSGTMFPAGKLGQPVGQYLKIEGVRVEVREVGKVSLNKVGMKTLLVDTVNGRKLRDPVPIWIENVVLPGAERCVLKGYENCRMIGQPPAVQEAAREAGKEIGQPQAEWQMQFFFVATSVVSPEGLRAKWGDGVGKP